MRTPIKHVITIAIVIAGVGFIASCGSIRDAVNTAMGLPTNGQIDAMKTDLASKDAQLAEASTGKDQAIKALTDAQRAADQSDANRIAAQQTAASIANELAQSADDPIRYEALKSAFDGAQSMVERYADLGDAARDQAANAQSQIAQYESDAARIDDAIKGIESQLAGVDASREAAFGALTQSVNVLGAQAQALGVPGAAAAADKVNSLIGTGLTLLFGVGGTGVYVNQRRKLRAERRRADAGEEVIAVTEEHGLISGDPEAKAIARERLSDDARMALARGKAKASPRRRAALSRESSATTDAA